jgi:hypothetical protein
MQGDIRGVGEGVTEYEEAMGGVDAQDCGEDEEVTQAVGNDASGGWAGGADTDAKGESSH